MRILIVDDNASLRQLLASLFTKGGHEVVAMLEDGSTQVETEIARTKPDLVCLDYNLPGRDGITILKSIQAMAPQINVLFMTAANGDDIEQSAADAGASGFIRKPFGQVQIMRELAMVSEARKHAVPIDSEPPADEAEITWPPASMAKVHSVVLRSLLTIVVQSACCSRGCSRSAGYRSCKPLPTATKQSLLPVITGHAFSASTSICPKWVALKRCR
jgi:CheY-like chemotaxis protein